MAKKDGGMGSKKYFNSGVTGTKSVGGKQFMKESGKTHDGKMPMSERSSKKGKY